MLNIGGQRVNVDDAFLSMSPQDQNAAVEKIAGTLHQQSGGGMLSDIFPEIKKAAGSAIDAMSKVSQRGTQGPIEGLMTTGRAAMAVPELLASPITGAARSLLGHPIAEAETTVGSMINPEVAKQRRESGAAYEDAKRSVDTALSAMRAGRFVETPAPPGTVRGPFEIPETAPTREIASPAPTAPPPAAPPTEGQNLVDAARRISGLTGSEVNVPRAIASDNIAVQRAGQGIRNIPIVGDRIPQATQDLVESLNTAAQSVADQYGMGSGPNVASRIGRTIGDAAEAETRGATEAAQRSDEALLAAHERDVQAAQADVARRENLSLEDARAAVGDMPPQEMGAALAQRLRTEEASARARKDALYEQAGRADASVRLDAVQGARNHVVQGLEDAGVVIDPQLTPAANRMLDEVQNLSRLDIPNRAQIQRPVAPDTERVGVTVQGIEQARKRLVSLRQAANNDADRRAARLVMDRFDDWQSQAFENSLLSGDDQALNAFRQARAANTEWRNRFFNDQEDADRIIKRIVTGEVTPQEVANYVIGTGQIGAKGLSSRLITRIAEATNNDPEAMQAIRGGIWNKLSQATEGADPKAAAKASRDIIEFLNGSGRTVAEQMFTPEQRRLMRAYADTLRNGKDARALISDVAKATRPGSMEVQPGPMKRLADTVLGKGGKSDEALFRAIDSYAKSGNRADVSTLSKLVQALPQEDRQNLAGAIIRNLGTSPRTGQFSPDVFVSQWKTYTPQAKAVLFGNAGPQRQAIDDIALISDRLKQVGSRFGNPSGTGQTVNAAAGGAAIFKAFASLLAGDIVTPLTILGTALGGNVIARILAAPAGAASTAKWARAYQAFRLQPTPQKLGLLQVASRNLANTAQGVGIKAAAGDIMRALQGPVPAGADEKQQ